MRRVGVPLGALLLAAALACQEKLTTPVDCPELCPGQSLIIRDTVLLPLAGLDSSYAGYVSAADVPALLVSDGLAAGEARAFATFPRQSDSLTVDGLPFLYTTDSVSVTFHLVARDSTVTGLRILLHRVPPHFDTTATFTGVDTLLTPPSLIDSIGALGDAREGRPERDDHYGALVRAIVGQQLSVLAARAIYGRLTERFGGRPPSPQEILADDPDELRAAAGLSRAKVGFLRSLAEHVISGELELERLDSLPDEEVIEELVAVKGLGLWTAHMFLMFHLERPDVLPVGDLGIRRAIERAYGLPALPLAPELERLAAPWRPYRTLACRYLWRSLRNEPG